jgi:hypothetical protein
MNPPPPSHTHTHTLTTTDCCQCNHVNKDCTTRRITRRSTGIVMFTHIPVSSIYSRHQKLPMGTPQKLPGTAHTCFIPTSKTVVFNPLCCRAPPPTPDAISLQFCRPTKLLVYNSRCTPSANYI